jgi:peptidase M23-like protein
LREQPDRGNRSNRRRLTGAFAVAVAVASLGASTASQSLGSVWRGGGGGGVGTAPPPKINGLQCVAKCAGIRSGISGSKVSLSGKHLGDVKKVQFTSRRKWIAVKPDAKSQSGVRATVPKGAKSGRIRVVDAYANHARSDDEFKVVDHLPPANSFTLEHASASPANAYYDGRRDPHLDYMFTAQGKVDVRIDVVRRNMDGLVVRSYVRRNVEPNTTNTLAWNGRNEKGRPAPNGSYRFNLTPLGTGKTATDPDTKFSFHQYEFPVRGPHSYGDGLGAGRGHQGQDVPAACGTRLVAASGGRVYWHAYQASGAGNYVVINTYHGRSMMYAHLMHPAIVQKGQRVHTGQKIGVVGETGDATGCHLHFELWSKPGWYQGGQVTNPTDDLKRWDGWS